MTDEDPIIDLVGLMAEHFNASREYTMCAVSHGQLSIDGHVIQPKWVRHWRKSQLQGRMLKCPAGERRICGGRLIEEHEQMTFGA